MIGYKTQCPPEYEVHYYSDKNKPPKNSKWLKIIGLIVFLFIIFHAINGCKTTKADDKRLEKIHSRHEALTASKLAKWYPPQKGSSHTDTLRNDSIKLYKNQAAVLRLQLKNQKPVIKYHIDTINNVVDTCVTIEDSQGSYDAGYNLGYKIGVYDGKGSCPSSTNTTTNIIPSEILVQIKNLQNDTSFYHDNNIKLTTERDIYHAKATKYTWLFWILIICGGVYGAFKIYNSVKPVPIKL